MSQRVTSLDIMSHLIPHLLAKGEAVHAYVTDAFWYDVGSTERYEQLDNRLIDQHLAYLSVTPHDLPLHVE